jgi:hypothetical protein
MVKTFFAFVLSVSMLFSVEAFAGAKGYKVVFVDLTPGEKIKPLFVQYRKTVALGGLSSCWGERKGDWIDIAYVKSQPLNVTPASLRLAAAGDAVAVKDLSLQLRHHRDDEITDGFDGAYLVVLEGKDNVIVGVSRDGSLRKAKPFRDKSIKSLDYSLCDASSAFDAAFRK